MLDDAGLPPDVKKEAWGIYKASGEVPNIDYVAGKKHFTTVTNPDGSKTYKAVEDGEQIAPPKQEQDPVGYLHKMYGTKWQEVSKQDAANSLVQAGFTPEQIAGAIGPAVTPGNLWNTTNYHLPITTPSTGTRGSDGGNNPPVVERTLKNGTKVKVRMTADGQWEKVD